MPTLPDGPSPRRGAVHHVEIWVRDVATAAPRWSWLLEQLGYAPRDVWPGGRSWTGTGGEYVVLESGPDVAPVPHDRLRPGVNHLAFWAGGPSDVDRLAAQAAAHGWAPLFADRYPHAGGPDHHAAYLEDADGFEVELVADPGAGASST